MDNQQNKQHSTETNDSDLRYSSHW